MNVVEPADRPSREAARASAPHATSLVPPRPAIGPGLRAILIAPVGGSFLVLDGPRAAAAAAPSPAPGREVIVSESGEAVVAGRAPVVPATAPSAEVLARVAGAPRRRRWPWALGALALIAGTLGTAHIYQRAHEASLPAAALVAIEPRDLQSTVNATGSLEAVTAIEVGAEVSGRVRAIHVEENEHVKKGQLLAEIDAEELAASAAQTEAQVAAASAALALAHANVEEAAVNLTRIESLAREGIASQQDLDAARAAARRSRAALAGARAESSLARAALLAAKSKVGKAQIVSPIDGVVLARLIEPGQTLTAGFQTPVLFRVAQDLTSLRLRVNLDEADIAKVAVGQRASFEVSALPGRRFDSRVLRVSRDSRVVGNVVAFGVTLEVDNSSQLLLPGMTCNATIVTAERKGALAVPNAALRELPSGAAPAPDGSASSHELWLVRDGAPIAVPVSAGIADDEYTEIAAGDVRPGDALILEHAAP